MPRTAAYRRVLALLAALPALAQADGDAPQAVFARVSASVATVLALGADGRPVGQGSGVWLSRERLVTNCHVVRDAARLEVQAAPGSAARPARWVLQDPSRDLCLLQADAGAGTPAVLFPGAQDPAIGERIHAVGNPLGFGLAVSSGLVSGFSTLDGERVIVGSAAMSPGSSGGGLFDDQGRLVGIATAVLGAGQNLNLVLPVGWVRALEQRGVAPVRPSAPPAPEPRWLDEAQALQDAEAWEPLERHARAWGEAQPTATAARLRLAQALINQQRAGDAEAVLREALRLDDHLAQGWWWLGVALQRLGRRAEAEQALDRALELLPASPDVHLSRARWLLDDGRAVQALPLVERALAIEAHRSQAWAVLGDVYVRLGRADEAQRAFRTALSLNERDEGSRQALARLLAGGGDADAAHRALLAKADAQQDARTWLGIGIADFNRQRHAVAEEAFRKATALDPALAAGWELLGRVLVRLQRDDEALPALDRALQLDAGLLDARLERSQLHSRRGRRAEALEDTRRATEAAPQSPLAWRALAVRSSEAGDPRAALAAYRRLDALGEPTADDLAQLGDLLGRAGERDAALAAFARAQALDPRHAGVLVSAAAFHGRAGDLERAAQYLERALAIDPRNVAALSSLGYTQMLRGQLEEAVKTLERAAALEPERANTWINLGHAQLRSRNLGRAITALEKALALSPGSADAHVYIAQAFLGVREVPKARQHAEQALALALVPDLPPALALAALGNLLEGRAEAAGAHHARLRSRDPQAARRLRAQALAGGLAAASTWPE